MTTFSVSFPALQDFHAHLDAIHAQLTDSTEQLIAQSGAATADMQGDTLEQMMQVHRELYQLQDQMNQAYQGASGVVAGMYEEYFNGDRGAASLWT